MKDKELKHRLATAEEHIKDLKLAIVESIKREKRNYNRFVRLRRLHKTMPEDRFYIAYLQSEIGNLEDLYADQQVVIEQYRRHFSKFGDFYSQWLLQHEKEN
jgi:predicted RNase H-like nuclease (RuvC/YqgF family)